jgi:hypothetical protein
MVPHCEYPPHIMEASTRRTLALLGFRTNGRNGPRSRRNRGTNRRATALNATPRGAQPP